MIIDTAKKAVKPKEELPFRLREPFLSTPEAALFRALKANGG